MMHVSIPMIIAAIFALAVAAPDALAQRDAIASTIPHSLRGSIIDGGTGTPLAGAIVSIPRLSVGDIADERGRFEMKDLPTGDHRVVFGMLGYRPDTIVVRIGASDRTIRIDHRLKLNPSTTAEIIVHARRARETDAAARFIERTAPTVVSVLSAEAIERSPDVSAAEAVKRVPGISINRVRGEARDAIVRGMEPRYNSTLVDGVKIPSPSEGTRVVSLDFMPSELLQRVEVTKVLTPDMEADAIGGSVNFVMRSAPQRAFLRARAATSYGTMLFDNDFVGFRTDSIFADPLERFGRGYQAKPSDFPRDNAKLTLASAAPDGMLEITAGTRMLDDRLGLLFGGSIRQSSQLSETVRNYESIDPDNNIYMVHSEWRLHSHSKSKYGLNLKADYVLDAANEIQASLVGLVRHNREARILSDTGEVFVPTLFTRERSVFQQHTILSAGFSGRHALDVVDIDWRAGWGWAQQYKPDRAEITTSNALSGDTIVSKRYFQSFDRDWQRNSDRDFFGGFDLAWKAFEEAGVTIVGGGFARLKQRSNAMNAYRLVPIPDPSTGELPIYRGLDSIEFKVANIGGTPEYSNNNYTASEDIVAGYLQARWEDGPWRLLAGARVEATASEYATHDVNLRAQVSATHAYVDILPSVHVRYALTDASNLRLSVGRSMSRPDYFDLVPYNYVGEDTRQMGNPDLARTISTNLDLRYEIFPDENSASQFSAGVFFKSIEDPVETALDLSNPSLPTIVPRNLGTATNMGLELVASMELFDDFSIVGNYTYTRSSIRSDKIRFDRQAATTIVVSEERSLQGQSEHVANVALGYRNDDAGTTLQLSTVFTGSRVARVSPYPGLDHVQTDYLTLDFSAEQRLIENLALFAYATNLLDSPYEVRVATGELIERETFGRQFTFGISYRIP